MVTGHWRAKRGSLFRKLNMAMLFLLILCSYFNKLSIKAKTILWQQITIHSEIRRIPSNLVSGKKQLFTIMELSVFGLYVFLLLCFSFCPFPFFFMMTSLFCRNKLGMLKIDVKVKGGEKRKMCINIQSIQSLS